MLTTSEATVTDDGTTAFDGRTMLAEVAAQIGADDMWAAG